MSNATAARTLLAKQFPWPAERPSVPTPPPDQLGWLRQPQMQLLAKDLGPQTQVVVELGSWLGLSTRFIADRAPQALIVAVDHWRGSPEHHQHPQLKTLLPHLYDTFLSLCWEYRERIQPLRMSTLEGLKTIAAAGLKPDLIYVDADHSYEAVTADLALCRSLFPDAILDGDDFEWPGVARAVQECSKRDGLQLGVIGRQDRAWTLRKNRPAWDTPAPTAAPRPA